MNWQLLLFAILGMAVGVGIVAARKGLARITAAQAWIKYALVLIVMLALVYWINTQIVRTIVVALSGCGAILLVDNNFGKNESK